MSELRYTADHEWVRLEEGVATVGITDYAAQQLGDVVYVDLPAVGDRVAPGAAATPTIRLETEMMPSFAPSTAARSHPVLCTRWCSPMVWQLSSVIFRYK